MVGMALVLVAAWMQGCGGTTNPGYHVENDEFTRTSSATVQFSITMSGAVLPRGSGVFLQERAGAMLVFTIDHPGSWECLQCHRVDILADGIPVPLGADSHEGNVRDGGVVEQISMQVPQMSIAQMASASALRIRICNDEYRADPELPSWLQQMSGPASSTPSTSGAASPTPSASGAMAVARATHHCSQVRFSAWEDHRTAVLTVCETARRYQWTGVEWVELN